MTFLNATLAFGLAAIAIPIALHFLARREPKKVVFPSLRFLTKRYESNRSRFQIRRWWLLALRIATVATVALAFARPIVHQSLSLTWTTIAIVAFAGVALLFLAGVSFSREHARSLRYGLLAVSLATLLFAIVWGGITFFSGPKIDIASAGPVAIAIVIDNSPTSAWKTIDDDRITRLQEIAKWIVTRVPRSSDVSVIDRSSTPASFALDPASALAQIEQLKPLWVTQPIASRIEAAVRLVSSSELNSRSVIVLSDLTAETWKRAIDSAELHPIAESQPSVSLTLFDLGEFQGINRSLSAVSISDLTPPVNSPVSLSAMVSVIGGRESKTQSVTAELEIVESDPALPVIRDGKIVRPTSKSVDRTSVQIKGNSGAEVLLTIPPLELGTHMGFVRFVGEDAMPLDDIRFFSIEVRPPSPVLIVCDDDDEARVLAQTITAPLSIEDPNAEYRVDTVKQRDLQAVRFADFDMVFFIDPTTETLTSELLSDYVHAGGNVLVALGPSSEPSSDLSATVLGSLELVRRWRVPPPGTFFRLSPTTHPIVTPLSELPGGVPWSSFRIAQYWQLQPVSSDNASTQTLASFAGTEHAAIVEVKSDSVNSDVGRVVIVATPLPALSKSTRDWNELFSGNDAWPAFLLVRQMTDFLLMRSGGESNTLVGQPKMVKVDPSDESRDVQGASPSPVVRRFQWYPPGETALSIPINLESDETELRLLSVDTPGVHWIRGSDFQQGFSVNLADETTNLTRIEPAAFISAFGSERFHFVTEREAIDLKGDDANQRVSLHSPLMLLVLLVFLLEQILSNRFYRSTTAGGAV